MSWCASMNKSRFSVKAEFASKVAVRLDKVGYGVQFDDDGNINKILFLSEKLNWDEDEIFNQIAPYVNDGSYFVMDGDENSRWKWVFKNGKAKQIHAKYQYDED